MKMYTLNVYNFLCIIYTLIKLKNPKGICLRHFLKVESSGNLYGKEYAFSNRGTGVMLRMNT